MFADDEFNERLDHIRRHVREKWNEFPESDEGYIIHNATHCENVEKAIRNLIPHTPLTIFATSLSDEESFCLLSSAWLHDIGMIPTLFGKKENEDKARKTHHIRSDKYVKLFRHQLGLNDNEATVIGLLCRYHRKSSDIDKCRKHYNNIRAQLLAAYLRLADALHIDKTRFDDKLFKKYLETGYRKDFKYHWLKNYFVKKVAINHNKLAINIHLKLSKRDAYNVVLIKDLIKHEIRSELHTVKDILLNGGISFFNKILTKWGDGIENQYKYDLNQIIGNIQLERKPSGSDVLSTVLDTIITILDTPDKCNAYFILQNYDKEIINDLVRSRPCHILIHSVDKILKECIGQYTNTCDLSIISNKIIKLRNNILDFKKSREDILVKLYDFAKLILSDNDPIILFGYSTLVINSLDKVDNYIKRNKKIYVLECKNKTHYNELNELIYCDGIEYALKLKKLGFKNIYLTPDILVGNILYRGLVSKVIFGANGIDFKSGIFGHTGGHLSVSIIANALNIPIYVIVDSFKFGEIKPNDKLQREINWISGERKIMAKLKGIKFFNPREDIIDRNQLSALVTDGGILRYNDDFPII